MAEREINLKKLNEAVKGMNESFYTDGSVDAQEFAECFKNALLSLPPTNRGAFAASTLHRTNNVLKTDAKRRDVKKYSS